MWPSEIWIRTQGMRHTKPLVEGSSGKLGRALGRLDKTQLRLLTELVTGHWYIRKHLARLGIEEVARCSRCGEMDETSLHLIMRCKSLAA